MDTKNNNNIYIYIALPNDILVPRSYFIHYGATPQRAPLNGPSSIRRKPSPNTLPLWPRMT